MTLLEQVQLDMKQAMRDRDKPRLAALRNIRAAFLEAMKSDGRESLPDPEALQILRRLAKARQESIAAYREGGREELAESEESELEVLTAYLPKLADEPQTRGWVREAIARTGAAGPSDMGKVMGALMGAHRDEMDGRLAQQLVKEELARL